MASHRLACCLLALALSAAASGVVLDRIVIVVNRQVITESQLEEAMRVTDFLNETTSDRNLDQRRAAAARLIDQVLLQQEMQLSHYDAAKEESAESTLENLRKAQGEADFHQNLERDQLTIDEVRENLALQAAILQFIEFRFRPQLAISEADLRNYYPRFAARWKADHPDQTIPGFDSGLAVIRQMLLDERTDQALDEWVKEARRRANIIYEDSSLTAP